MSQPDPLYSLCQTRIDSVWPVSLLFLKTAPLCYVLTQNLSTSHPSHRSSSLTGVNVAEIRKLLGLSLSPSAYPRMSYRYPTALGQRAASEQGPAPPFLSLFLIHTSLMYMLTIKHASKDNAPLPQLSALLSTGHLASVPTQQSTDFETHPLQGEQPTCSEGRLSSASS